MPKFPEFELLFGIDTLLSYLTEVVLLSIILTTFCWVFRDIFHRDSLSKGECPICHAEIENLCISIGSEKDISINVCECGYNSSPFLYILYNKAMDRLSMELDNVSIGGLDSCEKNK